MPINVTRAVTVQKEAGSRTYLGLQQTGKLVTVASVGQESPLASVIDPGDVVMFVNGQAATKATCVAKLMVEEAFLRLQVRTPQQSEIAFLPVEAQIDLAKDKSGLVRVTGARLGGAEAASATRDLEVGAEAALHPGDLLLAVTAPDGTLTLVSTPKEAQQRLKEAQQASPGLIEIRVVRGEREAAPPSPAKPTPLSACEYGVPTRCIATSAVRRTATPAASSPTHSGRSSPTQSHSGESSDGEHQPAHNGPAEGSAWRSMEQRQRRRNSVHEAARSLPEAEPVHTTTRMLQVTL